MSDDALDRERIEAYKRGLKMKHGYDRGTDHGRVIKYGAPQTLGEKLLRMETRTEAGEQALRTAPVGKITHKMRHARRSK